MKPISLSLFVVSCKDYKPEYDWYFCKSRGHIRSLEKISADLSCDEARLGEFSNSDDYVLMPECPDMTNDEAIEVVRDWCDRSGILYIDDTDSIEEVFRWYYKLDDYYYMDHEPPLENLYCTRH